MSAKKKPDWDIYVCMSTIPPRLSTLDEPVTSILTQTLPPNKIFISIPKKYKRFKISKSALRSGLRKLPKSKRIEIVRCTKDDGPGTKLLGCLERIRNLRKGKTRNFMVVLVDDDNIYKTQVIEKLARRMKRNDRQAYTYWSYKVEVNLPIAAGVSGCAINGRHLNKIEEFYRMLEAKQAKFFYDDDFWISLYLYYKGVKIRRIAKGVSCRAISAAAVEGLSYRKELVSLRRTLAKFAVRNHKMLYDFFRDD